MGIKRFNRGWKLYKPNLKATDLINKLEYEHIADNINFDFYRTKNDLIAISKDEGRIFVYDSCLDLLIASTGNNIRCKAASEIWERFKFTPRVQALR